MTDPAQAAAVHRVIGWLIDQGMPPDAAHELRCRAAATGHLTAAAHDLLEAADAGHDPDQAP